MSIALVRVSMCARVTVHACLHACVGGLADEWVCLLLCTIDIIPRIESFFGEEIIMFYMNDVR